jgi:hypothetical protein
MKINFIQIIGLATVVLSAFTFTGCVGDSDSAGLEYMPDMYRSPAIEPYVDYAEIRGREKSGLKTILWYEFRRGCFNVALLQKSKF